MTERTTARIASRSGGARCGHARATSARPGLSRSPCTDSHDAALPGDAGESAVGPGAALVTCVFTGLSEPGLRFPKPQVGGSTLPGRTTSSERGSAVCPRVKPICSRVRARRSVTPRSWRAGGESPESRPFWSRQDWPLLFSQARNWPRRSCEWFVAESRSELARRLAFEGEGGHREDAEGEARMDEA